MLFEKFIVKIIKDEIPHEPDLIKDELYEAVGTIGDKLLLVDSKGKFYKIYPEYCIMNH